MEHSTSRDNRIAGTLRLVGLKATQSRQEVLVLFSPGCKPLNADFICKKVASKKINRASVFRTLALLAGAGVLKKVDLRKGSTFYELNTRGVLWRERTRRQQHNSHHHHIVCTDCGKTESFKNCDIDKTSEKILKKSPLFKIINEHSLELFGTCKSCAH